MNSMVKSLVNFIDANHPTMFSKSGVTEVAPGVFRATIEDINDPGTVEVEFRVNK